MSALYQGSSSFYLTNSTNPTIWTSTDISLNSQSVYIQANTTSSENRFGSYTNHPLTLVTNNTERIRINSNGDVSIPGKLTNTGVAKAWVNFDGINGSVVGGEFRCNILKNYNIDRVVRTSTGRYTVYFTTPAPDAYYVVTGACNYNNANDDNLTIMSIGSQYTNYCQVVSRGYGSGAGYYNPSSMQVLIHY